MRAPTAALLLLSLAACGRTDHDGTYSGTIERADVQVGSLVGGRVARVLKREGESAEKGELLVELDPAEWQGAHEEAAALAAATERELDLLVAGAREEEIAQAKAEARRLELLWKVSSLGARPEEVEAAKEEVKAAEAKAEETQKEAERLKDAVRNAAEAVTRLDRAVGERDAAAARLQVARQRVLLLERGLRPEEVEAAEQAFRAQEQRVKALERGARPEEIAAKRAVLEAARARIAVAASRMAELKITAPAACDVQTLDLRPGDMLKAGAPVATLLLREDPWIVVYVQESDLARVRLGQPAEVSPDGHAAVAGTVTWISRRAEYTPRNVQTKGERVTQVFAVKLVLQGDVADLKDGMWADVRLK